MLLLLLLAGVQFVTIRCNMASAFHPVPWDLFRQPIAVSGGHDHDWIGKLGSIMAVGPDYCDVRVGEDEVLRYIEEEKTKYGAFEKDKVVADVPRSRFSSGDSAPGLLSISPQVYWIVE